MKEIAFWILFTGLFFISFITFLIIGVVRKNKWIIILGVIFGLITLGSGLYTGYRFVTKSYKKVNELVEQLKPRTGEEIYTALFGKPKVNCVKILNYQDQIIPKIDYAIWLHFKSCPEEIKRILSLHQFKEEKVSTRIMNTTGPLANDNWFKPENMGDTILVYKYQKDDYGNEQVIYCNIELTEIYFIDILD